MKQTAFLQQETLQGLRGRWGMAGAVCLFQAGLWLLLLLMEQAFLTGAAFFEQKRVEFFGISVLPMRAAVGLFFALLSFLLLTPLNLGVQKWFYRMCAEPAPDLRVIFDYLRPRQYGKALWLRVQIWLRTLLAGVLLAVPPLALWQAQRLMGGPAAALPRAALLLLAVVLAAVGLLLTLAFRLRYAAAPYLLAADAGLSARAALRLSARSVSAGRLLAMLLGWLRFLPAALLIVPIFFLLPYFQFQFAAAWGVRLERPTMAYQLEGMGLDLPA
ncbi:MAG: hypothetical protein HFE45_08515 [Oscillospiraceae bacterium]|nr:hypothetical protein [Oscillospiraceae bacterium]